MTGILLLIRSSRFLSINLGQKSDVYTTYWQVEPWSRLQSMIFWDIGPEVVGLSSDKKSLLPIFGIDNDGDGTIIDQADLHISAEGTRAYRCI